MGLTAGASTPEDVVQACVRRVCELGDYRVEEFRLTEERIMFPLPGELLADAQDKGVAIAAGNERAAERARAGLGDVRRLTRAPPRAGRRGSPRCLAGGARPAARPAARPVW